MPYENRDYRKGESRALKGEANRHPASPVKVRGWSVKVDSKLGSRVGGKVKLQCSLLEK